MRTYPNLLTVDLEEWFVAEILTSRYDHEDWSGLKSTVVKNTHLLLDLFQRKNVSATFFVLGWCAERYPGLLREILAEGHEIACHSFFHGRVDQMTPEAFRSDMIRATETISEACGARPRGFRAPSWSINETNPWAFDILAELGYEYDSSIFPIKHDIYGVPNGPTDTIKMKLDGGGTLWEIPASTYRLMGRNIPISGGGYLRHSPYWYTRLMIGLINRQKRPAVIYIHPWEVDPDPPATAGLGAIDKFRSKGATDLLMIKLEKLLSDFQFITCSDHLALTKKRPIGFG